MSGYYHQEMDPSAYYGTGGAQYQADSYMASPYVASAAPTTYTGSATYSAPEYYSAPYYANPVPPVSSNAAAYPVGYPTNSSTGGVPYPTGYTIESETGAVPYPAGYTPSAATANIVRVNTDENKKAAALAALPVMAPHPGKHVDKSAEKGKKKKTVLRAAGGEAWEDETLLEWDQNDFRIFCGDLGNEVTDDLLFKAFSKYPSVLKARVVRDKRTNKSKGYGFVSFKDAGDFVKAMKEMNGKYVGNRPIKLRKSTWKERTVDIKTLKKMQQTSIFKPVIKK
ncbi:uncharacterized protein SPPG_03010 [Spizellomyces punctatus DAOM BR117]|uniref:RRM domain-containing protein n=1 Tax=Spizellomyces punctatus (strain DAOM BR117) TaxID=645134 RepID=A0A0L0HN84_SPIPD|nr:uncharacterized protein SPPG_03010 [Spizellomyces punctatus DAOM BR117]KND02552.1 hypothetical protein SPPG_03010 [Spizellomyces punctatus DAOM BR117]|eukprot:XP_016610591.1 hypothetical protein SPPG_03010 [Spizellomyces punctatus DAOM BR117]